MKPWIAAVLACTLACAARAAEPEPGPAPAPAPARIAVMSAFDAELAVLRAATRHARTERVNGVEFTTGELQGKPVVLLLSGVSMTNAAMTTQLLLDRYRVSHIVFSGIAGGVDPALHIGDVAVPQRWAPYLEALYARETAPGRFTPPARMKNATLPSFGMVFPRPVGVRSERGEEEREWFEADPAMLQAARRLDAAAVMRRCAAADTCLKHAPALKIGGNGVSGSAFVDNAAFREYTFATFHAEVLDMETAAVAHVAYANQVPFIAFRSLSDLAGGGEGENELSVFFRLAADNAAAVVMAFLDTWTP